MLVYRIRIGFAVVSGDPIGDPTRITALVDDFTATCQGRVRRPGSWGRARCANAIGPVPLLADFP